MTKIDLLIVGASCFAGITLTSFVSPAHADSIRVLECTPSGMNQFSGSLEVAVDKDSHLTSSVAFTLSSVTRVTSPNETANPLPKIETFIDTTMTGELVVVPKGQLMVDETTVLTLNRAPGADKASLRVVLELPLKNSKLIRNGIVFEALCAEKPAQPL
ncbi:hypothetical protein BH10BDE1_BH10BDE1_13390 [soil metagenome]